MKHVIDAFNAFFIYNPFTLKKIYIYNLLLAKADLHEKFLNMAKAIHRLVEIPNRHS